MDFETLFAKTPATLDEIGAGSLMHLNATRFAATCNSMSSACRVRPRAETGPSLTVEEVSVEVWRELPE